MIKNFGEFLNEWDNAKVYDEPYYYIHAENIGGMYNGYNYHQMQRLMFSSSQFLMTIAAVNNLAKTKAKYKPLADQGMSLVAPIREFIDQVGSWVNRRGESYASKSNHYKNIERTLAKFKMDMSDHDRAVVSDIPKDLQIGMKWLIDILEFFRDSDMEKNFGDSTVSRKTTVKNVKLNLVKLNSLIDQIQKFIGELKKSDLNKKTK